MFGIETGKEREGGRERAVEVKKCNVRYCLRERRKKRLCLGAWEKNGQCLDVLLGCRCRREQGQGRRMEKKNERGMRSEIGNVKPKSNY